MEGGYWHILWSSYKRHVRGKVGWLGWEKTSQGPKNNCIRGERVQRSCAKRQKKRKNKKRERELDTIFFGSLAEKKKSGIDAAMCSFSCTYLFEEELAIELEAFT
jgi:hypothetical protein